MATKRKSKAHKYITYGIICAVLAVIISPLIAIAGIYFGFKARDSGEKAEGLQIIVLNIVLGIVSWFIASTIWGLLLG